MDARTARLVRTNDGKCRTCGSKTHHVYLWGLIWVEVDDNQHVSQGLCLNCREDQHPPVSGSTCCICYSTKKHWQMARIDSCKHTFCYSCIRRWSREQNTCPLCKRIFHFIKRADGKFYHIQRRRCSSYLLPQSHAPTAQQRSFAIDSNEHDFSLLRQFISRREQQMNELSERAMRPRFHAVDMVGPHAAMTQPPTQGRNRRHQRNELPGFVPVNSTSHRMEQREDLPTGVQRNGDSQFTEQRDNMPARNVSRTRPGSPTPEPWFHDGPGMQQCPTLLDHRSQIPSIANSTRELSLEQRDELQPARNRHKTTQRHQSHPSTAPRPTQMEQRDVRSAHCSHISTIIVPPEQWDELPLVPNNNTTPQPKQRPPRWYADAVLQNQAENTEAEGVESSSRHRDNELHPRHHAISRASDSHSLLASIQRQNTTGNSNITVGLDPQREERPLSSRRHHERRIIFPRVATDYREDAYDDSYDADVDEESNTHGSPTSRRKSRYSHQKGRRTQARNGLPKRTLRTPAADAMDVLTAVTSYQGMLVRGHRKI